MADCFLPCGQVGGEKRIEVGGFDKKNRIHRLFCVCKIVIWCTKSEFSQSKSIFLKIILDNGRNFASVKKDNNPSKKIELYQTIQKETIILLKKNRVIFSYFSMGG